MPKLFSGDVSHISLDRNLTAERSFNDIKKQKERSRLEKQIGREIDDPPSSSSDDEMRERKLPAHLRNDALHDTLAAIRAGRLDKLKDSSSKRDSKGEKSRDGKQKSSKREAAGSGEIDVTQLSGVRDPAARAQLAAFFRTQGTWDSGSEDDGAPRKSKSKKDSKSRSTARAPPSDHSREGGARGGDSGSDVGDSGSDAGTEDALLRGGTAAPPVRASDGAVVLTRPRPGTAAAGVSLRESRSKRGDAKRRRRERKREEEEEALGIRKPPTAAERLKALRKEETDERVGKLMKAGGLLKLPKEKRDAAERELRELLEGDYEEGAFDETMERLMRSAAYDEMSDASLEDRLEKGEAWSDLEGDSDYGGGDGGKGKGKGKGKRVGGNGDEGDGASDADSMSTLDRILAESDEEDDDVDDDSASDVAFEKVGVEEGGDGAGGDESSSSESDKGAGAKDAAQSRRPNPFLARKFGKPKFRFSYVSVPKETFGLTNSEVLAYDDRTLASIAPIKAYAPYRGGGDTGLKVSAAQTLRSLRGHRSAPSDNTRVVELSKLSTRAAQKSKKYRVVDSVQVAASDPVTAAAAKAAGHAVVGTSEGAAAAIPLSMLEDAEGGGPLPSSLRTRMDSTARSRSKSGAKKGGSRDRQGDEKKSKGKKGKKDAEGVEKDTKRTGTTSSSSKKGREASEGGSDVRKDNASKKKGGAKGDKSVTAKLAAAPAPPAPAAPAAAGAAAPADPTKLSRSQKRKLGAAGLEAKRSRGESSKGVGGGDAPAAKRSVKGSA